MSFASGKYQSMPSIVTNQCVFPARLESHYVSDLIPSSPSLSFLLLQLALPSSLVTQLTPTAIRDYNRARTYLRDLAKSDGIHVYSCLTDAVEKYLQLSLSS